MTVPRVLAFDLGTHMAACWNYHTKPPLMVEVASWTLQGYNRPEKLAYLGTHVLVLMKNMWVGGWRPDVVFYERPFARGFHATRMLWGIAGILEAWAAREELPVVDMPPGTIKAWATGKGGAKKEAMIEAAASMGYPGADEHEADAWCARAYAAANVEWE